MNNHSTEQCFRKPREQSNQQHSQQRQTSNMTTEQGNQRYDNQQHSNQRYNQQYQMTEQGNQQNNNQQGNSQQYNDQQRQASYMTTEHSNMTAHEQAFPDETIAQEYLYMTADRSNQEQSRELISKEATFATTAIQDNDLWWLLDGGSTCSVTFDKDDCYDIRKERCIIQVGGGNMVESAEYGKTDILQRIKGATHKVTISKVRIAPTFRKKIIAERPFLEGGCMIRKVGREATVIENRGEGATILEAKLAGDLPLHFVIPYQRWKMNSDHTDLEIAYAIENSAGNSGEMHATQNHVENARNAKNARNRQLEDE